MKQVFKSKYGRVSGHLEEFNLGHLVPKGHPLDITLAQSGIMIYSVYFLYPIMNFIPGKHMFFMAMAVGMHALLLFPGV